MVCYALLGKTRGKCQLLPLQKTSGTRTREGEVLSTPPLQPSSSLFQIAVLVYPDAGVQIELSKVVTHRQRQRAFSAERALSYSCFQQTCITISVIHTMKIRSIMVGCQVIYIYKIVAEYDNEITFEFVVNIGGL